MIFDTQRLATDPDYWRECGAPEDAEFFIEPRENNLENEPFFAVKCAEKDGYLYGVRCDGEKFSPDLRFWHRPIPRPKTASEEWVDGLPPVGCECEIIHPGIKNHGWQKATIKAYFDDRVAVLSNKNIWSDMNGYACIKIDEELQFRPIRTKQERQRDELADLLFNYGLAKRDAGPAADAIIADGWTKP